MSKQTINIGTVPNDVTGDTIRSSFNKANLNFTELYSAVLTSEAQNLIYATPNGSSGLPSLRALLRADISDLGTGVSTALGINTGSVGAVVLFNGAGGTPSSLTLTNATGLPISGLTGLGTNWSTAIGASLGSGWTTALNAAYSSSAGAWTLVSGGTLTGVNTITSNAKNQLIVNGTWTASAASDNMIAIGGTITSASALGASGVVINPAMTAVGTSSVQTALDIIPTFSGGTTPINITARFQGQTLIGTVSAFLSSEKFLIRTDQNADTYAVINNQTSGTAGAASFYLTNQTSLSNTLALRSLSGSFTTSGINVASTSIISSGSGGGLNIGTINGTILSFWANNAKQMTINGSGSISIATGSTGSSTFRTTNAGSDVVAVFLADTASSLTAGKAYGFDATNGFIFTQGNATRRIMYAAIQGVTLTSTAGSEAGGLGFYTQTGGAAAALNMTLSTTGSLSLANGNFTLSTAGNKLNITEGTNGSVGQTTLVSGTKAITISGLTTSSRAFVTLVSQGGTVTTTVGYAAVCTSNTLTITALTSAGATDTTDTSVLNYWIIN